MAKTQNQTIRMTVQVTKHTASLINNIKSLADLAPNTRRKKTIVNRIVKLLGKTILPEVVGTESEATVMETMASAGEPAANCGGRG